jgi:lipid-binding SYLF domain-containing protein
MKRLQVMIATLAIHILCISPLAIGAEQYPAQGSAAAPDSAAQTLETASQVFDRMFTSGLTPQERARIDAVLKDAYGFVVLPNILKMGVGITQIQGRGVLVFRDAKGVWQPPIPLLVSGTGVGPHFGLIAYDALIPIMKQISLDELLDLDLAFTGREAIGPLQTYATGTSGLVAYARAKGLSAGIAQDNIRITLDQQGIYALYGIHVEPHEIAGGKLANWRKCLPAQKLVEKVNEFSGGAPITTILTPQ